MLMASLSIPACGAAPASVSGLVRDSAGIPQIGARVQLLRPDLTVVATVLTNGNGHFNFNSVLPGRYAVKAMGEMYLPSLREDVRVRTATIVNLTLNTLYEVVQWLPSEPRSASSPSDDWKWTLRSAANRPLLRWLQDGPLVVVSDGSGSAPRLKARLIATGQAGTFGESGERFSAAVEDTPSDSRELLARVDFAPDSDAGMESMLGFRQDLGFAGSVQSVAAVSMHPEVDGPAGQQGLEEAVFRTAETMRLGDEFDIEAGSTEIIGRFADQSADTVVLGLPNASVAWHGGDTTVGYRVATMTTNPAASDETEAGAWMPALAVRSGKLAIEHGLHQEIAWQRITNTSEMAVVVFADNMRNPVVEAMGNMANAQAGSALYDTASGIMRAAGPGFSTMGVAASMQHDLPHGNQIRVSYANGTALVMPALPRAMAASDVLAAVRARRSQTYAISLSGTLEGTGTTWHASYRWQPDDTVTEVAPYALDAREPYMNLNLRQVIRPARDGVGGFEALLDVQNLLAQGYRPYIVNDGSVLIFAQQQRGIRGGLAFTF